MESEAERRCSRCGCRGSYRGTDRQSLGQHGSNRPALLGLAESAYQFAVPVGADGVGRSIVVDANLATLAADDSLDEIGNVIRPKSTPGALLEGIVPVMLKKAGGLV